MSAALVPVKALAAGKSRLAGSLPRGALERLALAMLGDVVDALKRVAELERVVVVTPDPRVAEEAAALGAEAMLRDDPGLNAALDAGARSLAAQGAGTLLVVLGDVPALRGSDVALLFEALRGLGGRGVVLAPSRDGGTSALLRAPWDAIPNGFGKHSAAAHREAAQRAGLAYSELPLASLAIDLDRIEDAEALRSAPGAPRTRALLSELGARDAAVTGELRLRGLPGVPRIAPGDDLAGALAEAARRAGVALRGGVLVVCQKVVSKQEGRLVTLAEVEPSAEAARIAREDGKDARQVEVVLRETRRVVRRGRGVLICETPHGFVCANAGVDLSNAPADGIAVLLPLDPDASARRLRGELLARGAGEPFGVVVSDTFGRPWREGLVDVAIGCAGFRPLDDWRGRADLRGRELTVTVNASADQLAAAAGLLMRKDAGVPAVWVEGFEVQGDGSARELLREPGTDLFR